MVDSGIDSETLTNFSICGRNPILEDKTVNLTYDDILDLDDEGFETYVSYMLFRLREIWDEQGIAPSNGWNEDDVRADFEQLASFPVHGFWRTDELTGSRVIHNTFNVGNSVNAWNLARMLKVRINYSEKDDGRSIYDFFAKDELFKRYFPYARRHFLRDSFYLFAQTVKRGDSLPHFPERQPQTAVEYCRQFDQYVRPYHDYELLIEAKEHFKYSGYADHLRGAQFFALTYDELKALCKDRVLHQGNLRIVKSKEFAPTHEFHVRLYKKGQKIFPGLFRSFKISMCQYAVNFPPLTAKLLYQEFLKGASAPAMVWDPSAGWAGRLLGALSADIGVPVGYIGTDPNPDFYTSRTTGYAYGPISVYSTIAEFYNDIRDTQSLFIGDTNTAQVYRCGSEHAHKLPVMKDFMGAFDMVFTSPPYFNREGYSEDPNQSYKAFPSYPLWVEGFLRPTLQNAYNALKPGAPLVWNIADVKIGKDKYLPLQEDSVRICKELGFTYIETIYMALKSMPGANRVDAEGKLTAKNMVKVDGRLLKAEPIFVFRK